jgi:hypothetical protein
MKTRYLFIVGLLLACVIPSAIHCSFIHIHNPQKLKQSGNLNSDSIMVASTGRSGSTLLTKVVIAAAPGRRVIKTHMLPPKKSFFPGKILFIFSNPDQAAESALHKMIHNIRWGYLHFKYVASADKSWPSRIGGLGHQTLENNLLSYDALNCYQHLVSWLHETQPTNRKKAQILAIKYEHLWEPKTIKAIKAFLDLEEFDLPPRRERGCKWEELSEQEIAFRNYYNLGTFEHPRYAAYDEARAIWEAAPPFQYLKLKE